MRIDITKNDTLILKGIAILVIILHNYYHWVPPVTGENEFSFKEENFQNLLSYIENDLIGLFRYGLSFFGHYAVQIFIFCSGYGLVKIYDGNFVKFIKKRLSKLYLTFTVGLIFLLIYNFGLSKLTSFGVSIEDLVLRYSMLANFVPNKIFVVSGPYWFYSMIIQLYVLFPFLLIIGKRDIKFLYAIILVSYSILLIFGEYFNDLNLSLYYNFLGNLPVFITGIILSMGKEKNIKTIYLLLSIGVFCLGQINTYIWYFSQLSFALITIPFFVTVIKKMNKTLKKWFIKTGELSMFLFVVNGFLRYPLIKFSQESTSSLTVYLWSLIHLLVVFIVAYILRYFVDKIKKRDLVLN